MKHNHGNHKAIEYTVKPTMELWRFKATPFQDVYPIKAVNETTAADITITTQDLMFKL